MSKDNSGSKKKDSLFNPSFKNDFTIYDFAHRDIAISNKLRESKLEINNWRMISGDPKHIYKLLSDNNSEDAQVQGKRKHKKSLKLVADDFDSDEVVMNCELPVDVWFLIARHIRPEDIASFGAICTNSLLVVRSAIFWRHLYKRFYKELNELPPSLSTRSIDRCHGLKGRVVRALYFFYDPFKDRSMLQQFSDNLESLIGQRCLQMWYIHDKNVWHFYFKFQRGNANIGKVRDDLRSEINVLANAENANTILEVQSSQYLPLPSTHSQYLIKAGITGMKTNKLMLYFNSCFCIPNKAAIENSLIITLSPISKVLVLPWWHPRYPY